MKTSLLLLLTLAAGLAIACLVGNCGLSLEGTPVQPPIMLSIEYLVSGYQGYAKWWIEVGYEIDTEAELRSKIVKWQDAIWPDDSIFEYVGPNPDNNRQLWSFVFSYNWDPQPGEIRPLKRGFELVWDIDPVWKTKRVVLTRISKDGSRGADDVTLLPSPPLFDLRFDAISGYVMKVENPSQGVTLELLEVMGAFAPDIDFDSLDLDNPLVQSMDFTDLGLAGAQIAPGESLFVDLPDTSLSLGESCYLIARYGDAQQPGEPHSVIYYYRTSDAPIPTLSEWALIILAIVILGAITYVMIRRRRNISSATA